MSIQGTSDSYIIRDTSSWFDPSQDWTKCFHLNILSAPGTIEVIWFYGAFDYGGKFIFLGIDAGATTLDFSYFDGVTETEVDNIVCGTGDKYITIRYTVLTSKIELFIDEVLAATLNVSLSTLDPQDSELFLNDGDAGGYDGNKFTVSYERSWQKSLTVTEITAEDTSITPVSVTSLLSSCPLQAGIDLTDHNGNVRQFSASGTVTTNTNDPLISVVAGPPTNTSPANATLVTVDSAVFQDTLTAGAATTVWHKFVAATGTKMHGAAAFGDLVTYKPDITIYDGLANANANTPLVGPTDDNAPLQAVTTAGNTYYIKSNRNGAVTPATLILSILEAPNVTAPINSFAINDDTEDYPVILIGDGGVLRVVTDIVSGEAGDVLDNGYLCLADAHNNLLAVYNQVYDLIGTLPYTAAGESFGFIRSHLSSGTWYVGDFTTGDIKVVRQDATFGPTTYTTGITALRCIAVNSDRTIAYCSDDNANLVVKWNLTTNTLIGTFVAYIATFIATDIIVLSDDTVLICWTKSGSTRIIQYDTSAVALHTHNYTGLSTPAGTVSRMFRGVEDNGSYGLLNHDSSGQNNFLEVKISDGSVLRQKDILEYEVGEYQGIINNTPVRFGSSFSCVAWMTRISAGPVVTTASGLYKLTGTNVNNARVLHDSTWIDASVGTTQNVAIPNPFAESYLAGDE